MRRTLHRLPALALVCILFLMVGCGAPRMQSSIGQTVQQVEADNPGLHLHTSSTVDGAEVRTYRNWSWTSVGSYFKPNRTYRLTFRDGMLVSWAEL